MMYSNYNYVNGMYTDGSLVLSKSEVPKKSKNWLMTIVKWTIIGTLLLISAFVIVTVI